MGILVGRFALDRIKKKEAEKKANYGNEYGFWGPKKTVTKEKSTWGTPMLGKYNEEKK